MIEKIRLSKEQQDRHYIKEELIRYYAYKQKCMNLEQEIIDFEKHYRETIDNPSVGGSIIDVSNHSFNNEHIVIRMEGKLYNLKSNLVYYKSRCELLDTWLSMLTESQKNVIKLYVCEYQCQNREQAAKELYCESENVKKQTERGIERIRKLFPDIF